MAHELTWTFNLNNTPLLSDTAANLAKSFLFEFKQSLLANGWIVFYSCDSLAASDTDLWVDLDSLVPGAALTPHSWITLQFGLTDYYLTVDYQASSDNFFRLLLHKVEPTIPADPLIEAPSSTGMIELAAVQFARNNIDEVPQFSFAHASNGCFWASVDYLLSYRSPFWIGAYRVKDQPMGSLGITEPAVPDHDWFVLAPAWADSGDGALGSLSSLAASAVYGWGVDAELVDGAAHVMGYFDVGGTGTIVGTGSPINGDDFTGKMQATPLILWGSGAGKTAYLGRIPDLFMVGNSRHNIVDSDSLWLCMGKYAIPANGGLQ